MFPSHDLTYKVPNQFSCDEMVYSQTFRGNKSTVNYLQESKLDTRITNTDWAVDGEINEQIPFNAFLEQVEVGDLVLCRYNRGKKVENTLDNIALQLLTYGKPVTLLGSLYDESIYYISYLINKYYEDEEIKFQDIFKISNVVVQKEINKEMEKKRIKKSRIDMLETHLSIFNLYVSFYIQNVPTETQD